MVITAHSGRVAELTAEQGRVLLEERAHRAFGIDLDEFVRRWFAGEYGNDPDDDSEALALAMMLPIAGINPWADGSRP